MKLNKRWFRAATYLYAPNVFTCSLLLLFGVSGVNVALLSILLSVGLGIYTGRNYPLFQRES